MPRYVRAAARLFSRHWGGGGKDDSAVPFDPADSAHTGVLREVDDAEVRNAIKRTHVARNVLRVCAQRNLLHSDQCCSIE